jgi:putative membrane protein insertion efficiency factor
MDHRGESAGSRASVGRLPQLAALRAIRLYQLCLSPFLAGRCRYVPSCSHYAAEAIERHGLVSGAWLAVKRIGRCRPGAAWGYDPVPERDATKRNI